MLTTGGRTLAQGAVGWIWAHHPHAIPLPGFRNCAQVDDSTAALRLGPLPATAHAGVQAALDRPNT